jgi:tryptophan 2,3-dioxygenase
VRAEAALLHRHSELIHASVQAWRVSLASAKLRQGARQSATATGSQSQQLPLECDSPLLAHENAAVKDPHDARPVAQAHHAQIANDAAIPQSASVAGVHHSQEVSQVCSIGMCCIYRR